MRLRIIALFAAAAITPGCVVVPWPHTARLAPGVEGFVFAEGVPVAGVMVTLCEATGDACCTGKSRASLTDSQGRFVVDPPLQFRFFAYIMAHRQFHWCLVAERGNDVLQSGPFHDYSLHDTGPVWDYSITCELSERSLSCAEPQMLRRDGA